MYWGQLVWWYWLNRHKVSNGVMEEINFDNNIEIPSDDEMVVDEPKK